MSRDEPHVATCRGRCSLTRWLCGPEPSAAGSLSTLGYWDSRSDDAAAVERQLTDAIAALDQAADAEISMKLSALAEDSYLERLATAAQAAGVGVHCDSLQPSTQDAAIELASSCRPAARA